MFMKDFLIIGGGVIGLAIAYHLGKQGASVTVLDAVTNGIASPAAAGMLAPLAEAARPGPLLDLALDSLRRFPDFVAALNEDGGTGLTVDGPGMLRVARTDDEAAALCRALAWQTSLGLPLHRLSPAEARRLESGLGPDVLAAVLSPGEKQVEPRRLLRALKAACEHRGVCFVSASVAGIESDGGRAVSAVSDAGRHTFGSLVVAGGSWSGALAAMLGFGFPVAPLRGQILALGPQSPAPLRHTVYTHDAYLVPRADGRVVVGATEEWAGFEAETDAGALSHLRAEAARLVPALAAWPLHSAWAGLRPVSRDGLPLLGRVPGWDNVHAATGHGRNGILLTPATGALMADHLLHDAPPPAAFDPARFGEAT